MKEEEEEQEEEEDMEEEEEDEEEELLYKNVDFVLAVIKTIHAGNYLPRLQRPSFLRKKHVPHLPGITRWSRKKSLLLRANKVSRNIDGCRPGMWILWSPQIQTLFVSGRTGMSQTSRQGGY